MLPDKDMRWREIFIFFNTSVPLSMGARDRVRSRENAAGQGAHPAKPRLSASSREFAVSRLTATGIQSPKMFRFGTGEGRSRLPNRGPPPYLKAYAGQPSNQIVTGPSLMSATSISAPNLPWAVLIPCSRNVSAKR